MTQATVDYEFYPASDKQKEYKILANMVVTLVVGGEAIVKCRRWQMRNGKNGPFACAPQYKTNKKDDAGKDIWANYVQFFPRKYDKDGNVVGDNSDQYRAFQDGATNAYQQWLASGGEQSGTSTTSAPSPTKNVPKGWTTNVDTSSGKRYYITDKGAMLWEGTPELNKELSAAKGSGSPSPADVFAGFNK